MKVLQIIDSLDAGGAERMAVNIANVLANAEQDSHLCVTRKEGLLKESIDRNVKYLFLEKKGKLGLPAIFKLHNYMRVHQIDVVHSHSTSAFIAVLSFLLLRKKPLLIWHDHYGKANELDQRPLKFIRFISRYFDHVISVNKLLKNWASEQLHCKQVTYLENFAITSEETNLIEPLNGTNGRRIVCLANLREQKDHFNLIHAFEKVCKKYPEWTLHLCGQDFNDVYSSKVKNLISEKNLQNSIFLLGSRSDVSSVLLECDIAVLSSKSEGLPVALLEYGLYKLPVVATNVGACAEVILNNGKVVPPENEIALSAALMELIENPSFQENFGNQFHQHVIQNYGSVKYIKKLLRIYQA